MWATKMMLPEHRNALARLEKEAIKKTRPILHEDEMEDIYRAIHESLVTGSAITVMLFGEYENSEHSGVVAKIDPLRKMIQLQDEWIVMADIIGCR